jgi:uncharacterized membrane protein HdeD (DUF308 family)
MNGNASLCCCFGPSEQITREFQHIKSGWIWFFLYGILLTICGAAAIIFPALTVLTTFAALVVLGVALMIGGMATIIASLWAGKWSGMLLQLLVGILYLVVGFIITDKPEESAIAMTVVVSSFFIVVGAFRTVAALMVQFPHWGWALLNGVVTFLLGLIIYRHAPEDSTWVLGLLIGVEMLLNGWTWVVLSLSIKSIPLQEKAE